MSFQINHKEESRYLTDHERRKKVLKDREQLRHHLIAIRSGKPSSKEGRDQYYRMKSIPGLSLAFLMNLRCLLFGTKVWYSESGERIEY